MSRLLPARYRPSLRPGDVIRIQSSLVVAALLTAAPTFAGDWELAVHAGLTAPTYQQSFQYRPTVVPASLRGLGIRQEGAFGLDAEGGMAFGGSLTYYFVSFFGIEGRIDTLDIDVRVIEPRFTASLSLPRPLPDLTSVLDLEGGSVDVDRVFPLSVNLKARTPGRVGFVASGGFSYLPELTVVARQPLALGVTGIGGLLRAELEIPTVELRAEATPEAENLGRFGVNAGAGLQVSLGGRWALTSEVRFFRYPKQTFRWRRTAAPASAIEELLLQELEARLPAVELEPTFYQATAAIVVRF